MTHQSDAPGTAERPASPRRLPAITRGRILDLVVFAVNLLFLRLMTRRFTDIVRQASDGDRLARLALGAYFGALFVLPAAGAILSRWQFNLRRQSRMGGRRDPMSGGLSGCLFHPAWYLSVTICIYVCAGVLLGDDIFGPDFNSNAPVFVSFIFGGLLLCVLQTILVYRYFSPPRKPPRLTFLREPISATLGDACIFLNMILFQVLWGIVAQIPFSRVRSASELAGRIFFLGFVALLLYFPPRIFYLAEDIDRPSTWWTILLANSPTIVRALIGF
jgi:hypothetical protein